MTDILHLDYETYSRVDLLLHGAYNYAQDPSTGIHCAGWAVNDDPVQIWLPGQPVPKPITDIFKRGKPRTIHAHNANFERLISWYVFCPEYDVPEPPIEAFYCTATQARRRALPGGLDNLGKALKLDVQKSLAGKQLIRKLCIPWKNGKINFEEGEFNRDPELLRQLCYEYCPRDVEVERAAEEMSPPLTDDEFADYIISEKVNDRGLMVDFELAEAAAQYVEKETEEIGAELSELTDGVITRPRQFQRLKDYFAPLMERDDVLRKMMTRHKTDRKTKKTEKKISLDKTARSNIMLSDHEFDPAVRPLVELIDEAGRSSTSKFTAMCMRADPEDDRVRGAYIKDGAVQTGRWASVGLQLHNFSRDCAKDPEALRADIVEGCEIDNVMDSLASMLRPAVISAPGHSFVCGDWSSIEARVLPWLAQADHILDEYREIDADPELPDMYEREAARMNVDDRQIGKVACIAEGQLVLTDQGLVPIENVSLDMRVWDGVKFTYHQGVTYKGYKEVFEYEGLTATTDHIVWTEETGACRFGDAARRGEHLVQSGTGGTPVWVGEDPHHRTQVCSSELANRYGLLSMHRLRSEVVDKLVEFTTWKIFGVPGVLTTAPSAAMVRSPTDIREAPLRVRNGARVGELWWPWNMFQLFVGARGRTLGDSKYWVGQNTRAGSHRQQWPLRTRQLAVGFAKHADKKHPALYGGFGYLRSARMALRTAYRHAQTAFRFFSRRDTKAGNGRGGEQTKKLAHDSRKAHVYDIVNAGDLNRFTVSNCLVHNCLSLGYQGGVKAFQTMARNYGIAVEDAFADKIKKRWRTANKWASKFWYACQGAAERAMKHPGQAYQAKRLYYVYDETWDTLWCILPSGKALAYPQPQLKDGTLTCIKANWTPAAGETEWPRVDLYGGMFAQGATQAVSAEILARGLRLMEDYDWPVVGHTHDEILAEVLDDEVDECEQTMRWIMLNNPDWSEGLPLNCSIWTGKRYRK